MANPTTKVSDVTPGGIKAAVTIRYKPGMREMALRDWFADNCTANGVIVTIPELGLSRRYKDADSIPAAGDYAPGHGRYAFIVFRSE